MIEHSLTLSKGLAPPARTRRRADLALSTVLLICVTANTGFAKPPTEHTLKAAYLYNFTRYISWPDDAWPAGESDFLIGVIGNNPFDTTLDQIAETRLAQKRR